MDRETFLEMIFHAMGPRDQRQLCFGTEVTDYRNWMEKYLRRLEERLSGEDSELAEKLRENYNGAVKTTEKSYFIAGMQFGAQFLYAALGSD